MAGRGKAGKAAKGSAKKQLTGRAKSVSEGTVTNGAVRRLARRGGVKRISLATHQHVKTYIDDFLERVVRDSLTFAEHSRRVTISAMDVVYALKKNGRVLYGYGS